jgi:hypothetical protein
VSSASGKDIVLLLPLGDQLLELEGGAPRAAREVSTIKYLRSRSGAKTAMTD